MTEDRRLSGLSEPDRDSIARAVALRLVLAVALRLVLAVALRLVLAVLLLASAWSLVNAWVDWRMAPLLERLDALALSCGADLR